MLALDWALIAKRCWWILVHMTILWAVSGLTGFRCSVPDKDFKFLHTGWSGLSALKELAVERTPAWAEDKYI